jgi:hypothetical protein
VRAAASHRDIFLTFNEDALMMEEAALSPLKEWETFYVIVGSSAGALTGLQFVVMALIADAPKPSSMKEVRAFGSPTLFHFCTTLLVSAIMSAPWHGISGASVALIISGAAGLAYAIGTSAAAIKVTRHARTRTRYEPDREDWAWYIVVPLVAYTVLTAAASVLAWHPAPSLFVIAATSLLLLFIGIRNSWDTVTYIAIKHRRELTENNDKGQKNA